MTRLYVVCEGLTEVNFVRDVISPQIEACGVGRIVMAPPNLRGYRTYAELRKFIRNLLNGPEVSVTTLIDLFKLPVDFPGLVDSQNEKDPYARVEYLERSLFEDFGDNRFWPHLQLHEFEALLFADLVCLATYYPERKKALERLAKKIESDFLSPEHINKTTPPSQRIMQVVPEYAKETAGIVTILEIGLEKIRKKCQHFNRWMTRLESIS
jgi:hypothetical protein